jgi:hypothetical protein
MLDMSKHTTSEIPTVDNHQLATATGGVSARWLGNHPFAAQAFLEHHPQRAAQFTANHPWKAARIDRIAGAY